MVAHRRKVTDLELMRTQARSLAFDNAALLSIIHDLVDQTINLKVANKRLQNKIDRMRRRS